MHNPCGECTHKPTRCDTCRITNFERLLRYYAVELLILTVVHKPKEEAPKFMLSLSKLCERCGDALEHERVPKQLAPMTLQHDAVELARQLRERGKIFYGIYAKKMYSPKRKQQKKSKKKGS